MPRYFVLCLSFVLAIASAVGQELESDDAAVETAEASQAEDADALDESASARELAAAADSSSDAPKTLAGMSILGNEEAPKSLVIVPWKSSEIGDGLGVTDAIDERARPVDKEVFLREVHYYELRSGAGG